MFKRIKIRKRNTFHPDREKLDDEFKMPPLEQSHVESFTAREGKATSPKVSKSEKVPLALQAEPAALIALRNKYQSKRLAKDIELRAAKAEVAKFAQTVDAIRGLLGESVGARPTITVSNGAEQWIAGSQTSRREDLSVPGVVGRSFVYPLADCDSDRIVDKLGPIQPGYSNVGQEPTRS